MRLRGSAAVLMSLLVLLSTAATQKIAARAQTDTPAGWKEVEQVMGKPGSMQAGDVLKFSFPRSDLKVMARGVQLKPAFALGTWVAFKKMIEHTMVMGDLVLTEDEVTPVMTKLQQSGIEQTALHNHVLDESPRVIYMHISAHGDPVKIAGDIRAALAITKTPLAAPAQGAHRRIWT